MLKKAWKIDTKVLQKKEFDSYSVEFETDAGLNRELIK